MEDLDILKDILDYRIANQMFYNESIIHITNPEVRQMFVQLRDDETRAVMNLQEKIKRMQTKPNIISKIFPTRPTY
ncbi:MAG: hypothetical protein ACOYVK_06940 [Bacillota bacterium]